MIHLKMVLKFPLLISKVQTLMVKLGFKPFARMQSPLAASCNGNMMAFPLKKRNGIPPLRGNALSEEIKRMENT